MDNIEASTCRIVAEQITIKKSLFFNLSYIAIRPIFNTPDASLHNNRKKICFHTKLVILPIDFLSLSDRVVVFSFFSLDTAKKFLFPPSNDTMIGMSRSKRKRLYLLDYDFVNCDDCCLPI